MWVDYFNFSSASALEIEIPIVNEVNPYSPKTSTITFLFPYFYTHGDTLQIKEKKNHIHVNKTLSGTTSIIGCYSDPP